MQGGRGRGGSRRGKGRGWGDEETRREDIFVQKERGIAGDLERLRFG
jgi:hypothetical protein